MLLLFSFLKMNRKSVSSPMHTKASENMTSRSPLANPPSALASCSGIQKLKTSEAITKPTTNLGNRSQITFAVGRSVRLVPRSDQ